MASSYTVTWDAFKGGQGTEDESLIITYEITADSGDGSVDDITTDTDYVSANTRVDTRKLTDLIKGRFLRMAEAFPTSGGTAPDAADVTVSTADGLDLLNAGGANLIHATDTQAIYPLMDDVAAKMLVNSALTIAVANQATASADITIRLYFI